MALVAVIAGGGFALLAMGKKPSTVAGNVQARVKQIVQTGLEAVDAVEPEAPPAPEPQPAPVAAPRAKRKRSPRRAGEPELTVQVADLGGAPLPEVITPAEPAVPGPAEDATVYGADADGVEPAVLVRPHLPTRPPPTVPADELGVLELVVDQMGTVDHVRLVSRENRYQDRMIVAAAKAWRFQPATKDGFPVRSRLRIRVTL